MESISKTIRNIRLSKHISQEKLSLLTGIPQSTISYIENDPPDVKVSHIIEIAYALNVCPKIFIQCKDFYDKCSLCDKQCSDCDLSSDCKNKQI